MSAFEFIPNTPEDQRKMLAEIGLANIEELFADIPAEVLKKFKPMGLEPLSELEAKQLLTGLAQQNAHTEQYVSFLGGGIYDHYVPAIISHLVSRGEFLTCYTPYQAELSQGTLTWMFEFQTMICELTGMGGSRTLQCTTAARLSPKRCSWPPGSREERDSS